MRLFFALAPLVAITAFVASPALAQDEPVRTLERATPLAAEGDRLLLSAFDPAIDAFRLVLREDGVERALPVQPTPEPLEADLGTNSSGDPAAILSLDVGQREGGASGRPRVSPACRGAKAWARSRSPRSSAGCPSSSSSMAGWESL